MIYGDVCSGISAHTVAWEPLGWNAQWYSEIEPFPSAVLNHHYRNVPNLGDMTKMDWPAYSDGGGNPKMKDLWVKIGCLLAIAFIFWISALLIGEFQDWYIWHSN